MKKERHPYPIVSICCMAFNHAPYIRKCLDGFLMQEPPTGVSADEPWYEILIHDDCSTDGTDDIIREYAVKYPDKIFPLYEEENQYSKGKVIDAYNYNRARGRYIAVCEGDDFWTDPYKLQKQVDFMDSHLNYSLCFHRVMHYNVYTNEYKDDDCQSLLGDREEVDITIDDLFNGWYTQPLSELFRVSMYDKSLTSRYKHYRDMHETYHLMQEGKCRLMNFYGGVRIVHSGGIASSITRKQYCDISLPIDREFFWKTLDNGPRKNYIGTLDTCVKEYAQCIKWKAIYCALVRFFISGHPHSLWRNFKLIVNAE